MIIASATAAAQTGAQASPSASTGMLLYFVLYGLIIHSIDQQVQPQPAFFHPELSAAALREQFEALSKLLSVSSNRLAVAPALFSRGLITFECYRNATEGSNKTEEERSSALMISLMSTISTQPELLTKLIDVLNRIEPFVQIAAKLVEASYC